MFEWFDRYNEVHWQPLTAEMRKRFQQDIFYVSFRYIQEDILRKMARYKDSKFEDFTFDVRVYRNTKAERRKGIVHLGRVLDAIERTSGETKKFFKRMKNELYDLVFLVGVEEKVQKRKKTGKTFYYILKWLQEMPRRSPYLKKYPTIEALAEIQIIDSVETVAPIQYLSFPYEKMHAVITVEEFLSPLKNWYWIMRPQAMKTIKHYKNDFAREMGETLGILNMEGIVFGGMWKHAFWNGLRRKVRVTDFGECFYTDNEEVFEKELFETARLLRIHFDFKEKNMEVFLKSYGKAKGNDKNKYLRLLKRYVR